MKVAVITVSDRASQSLYEDKSRPQIEKLLKELFPEVVIVRMSVPDARKEIMDALYKQQDADYILTCGGTGISPRDVTPDVTREFCEKPVPGIAEVLRAQSYRETPFAMFSRGFAGVRGNTVVANFPGPPKAAEMCTKLLMPVMMHGIKMIRGEGHE